MSLLSRQTNDYVIMKSLLFMYMACFNWHTSEKYPQLLQNFHSLKIQSNCLALVIISKVYYIQYNTFIDLRQIP